MDKWPTFTASKYLTAGKNIYDHKITTFDPRETYFASQASLERTGGSPRARTWRELNPNQKMINRKTLGNFSSINNSPILVGSLLALLTLFKNAAKIVCCFSVRGGCSGSAGPGKGRSHRGRTVLTEKQRTILTACFQHNPKPDALLKVNIITQQAIATKVSSLNDGV